MSSVPSQLRPGATFVTYSNGDKAQIEGGKEVVRSRKPTEGEVTLQFWRHKFPKAAQYYEPVHGSGTADGHQQPLYQLKIPSQGVTVIYHSQIDRVQEVIEYAPL